MAGHPMFVDWMEGTGADSDLPPCLGPTRWFWETGFWSQGCTYAERCSGPGDTNLISVPQVLFQAT